MKASVVRIGNSRGIRIPKTVLEHCHLTDAVELDVRDDHLVIRSLAKPRRGWDEAFRRMHQHGDDALLDRESLQAAKWDRIKLGKDGRFSRFAFRASLPKQEKAKRIN